MYTSVGGLVSGVGGEARWVGVGWGGVGWGGVSVSDCLSPFECAVRSACGGGGGQGTGKTHTMLGVDMWMLANAAEQLVSSSRGSGGGGGTDDAAAQEAMLEAAFRRRDKWGAIPRCMEYLFQQLDSEALRDAYTVRAYCSYLEIYNERVFDLLAGPGGTGGKGGGGAGAGAVVYSGPGLDIRQDKMGAVVVQVGENGPVPMREWPGVGGGLQVID